MTGIAVTGFYTCIVLRVGIFGSEIIAEEHFKTEEKAQEYANSVRSCGVVTIIAEV